MEYFDIGSIGNELYIQSSVNGSLRYHDAFVSFRIQEDVIQELLSPWTFLLEAVKIALLLGGMANFGNQNRYYLGPILCALSAQSVVHHQN